MSATSSTCTLFLCGDVMLGRGIDQILWHPSDPRLHESVVKSAEEYVALAERAHGSIGRQVGDAYVWGAALEELERRAPAARIVNLETAVTTSDRPAPRGINYRMHPSNIGVLSAARIDCAVLANNHVLDWGAAGLRETLDTLGAVGIATAGAGRTQAQAEAPAALALGDQRRVLVFSVGAEDSGVPREWAATGERPGVNWTDLSSRALARLSAQINAARRPGDLVMVSIHWGGNWGFEIPTEHREFAHALIDQAGVDLVHGHSSHHVKAIEVYRGHAILYGCGDFLNDYEGIEGSTSLRDDLTLMYFPTLDAAGRLVALEAVPLLIRRFRLQRPGPSDTRWLLEVMDRECRIFGAKMEQRNGTLHLQWN